MNKKSLFPIVLLCAHTVLMGSSCPGNRADLVLVEIVVLQHLDYKPATGHGGSRHVSWNGPRVLF